MADTPLAQTIQDAEIDARSLSEFISKDAEFMVTRRLAPTVHTLDYYIAAFNDVENNLNAAVDTVVQNAGAAVQTAIDRANTIADNVATSAANTARTRIDKILNDAINDSGFVVIDSFEDGATLTSATQALRVEATGKLYRWGGALPKTVPASSTPQNTGGFGLDAWVEVNDAALKQELQSENGYRLVANQLSAAAYGVPSRLTNIVEYDDIGNIAPVGFFDDALWGLSAENTSLYKSYDFGETWEKASSSIGSSGVWKILPTGDGEILALSGGALFKSQGFSTNPLTATWSMKLQKAQDTTAMFLKFGFDGFDNKFAVTHYSAEKRADSRYVWLSTDYGETWDIVYDSNTFSPEHGPNSHIHALCYDKWYDRFYFAEGHSSIVGIYYSDDDGQNWSLAVDEINGSRRSPAFTTMTATDFGIVCGTDGHPNGIWIMRRDVNPSTVNFEYAGAWSKDTNGVIGFADHSFRDPDTGIVYVGFGRENSAKYDVVPNVIFAVGSAGANIVYQNNTKRVYAVFAAKGKLFAKIGAGAADNKWIKADLSKYTGVPVDPIRAADRGNLGIGEGQYTDNLSMRAGVGSQVGSNGSVALGVRAVAGNQGDTVVGTDAIAVTGDNNVIVGFKAKGSTRSAVLGANAEASGAWSVAVGHSSSVGLKGGVSIGYRSSARAGVAIGQDSVSAAPAESVAIGKQSSANGGIAMGYLSSQTGNRSNIIGANASVNGSNSTGFGDGVEIVGSGNTAIGRAAKSNGSAATATAVGSDATVTAISSTAIGANSIASSNFATALGAQSSATHISAVALGRSSSTQRDNSVCIGSRDLESTKDGGAIFLKSPNGTLHKVTVSDEGDLVVTTA